MAADSEIAVLTAGRDRPYAYGLATALLAQGIHFDFIASDDLDFPELRGRSEVNVLNLRGDQRRDASAAAKVSRVLIYYGRLIRYAATARPRVFHILWNNKFEIFDRTLLMIYYRLLGKKIILTLHNVNAGRRDSNDTFLNRLTLRIQYRLAHHIFVHTKKMRAELVRDFGVREALVTVIPFGINNSVSDTALTPFEARRQLGIAEGEKAILFFGNIAPYKGLEYLVDAFQRLAVTDGNYRLVIVGAPKHGFDDYWSAVKQRISAGAGAGRIVQRIEYVPDEETELYFKGTDVLVLPYTHVFQSGVLFLAYSFGLPVIASDVGSMKEDVVEGETGFVVAPRDSDDLAKAIERYFGSELFRNLNARRQEIRDHANKQYSWDVVGRITRKVYSQLAPAS